MGKQFVTLSLAAASRVHLFCNLQSRARTHAVLVIDLYELLSNPTFVTHCSVDVQYFPFDTQKCIVEIISWAYAIEELHITPLHTVVQTEDMS
jgi:hypothetical protein